MIKWDSARMDRFPLPPGLDVGSLQGLGVEFCRRESCELKGQIEFFDEYIMSITVQ